MRLRLCSLAAGLLAGAVVLAAAPAGAREAGPGLLRVPGKLTKEDPTDSVRKGSHARTHKFKMEAGKVYQIDLVSREGQPEKFDPYLRLEDPSGRQVAADDDGGGFPNARILYVADKAGTYKIIATTLPAGQTGKYLLTVKEVQPTPEELLTARVKNVGSSSPEEQKKIYEQLRKRLEERKGDISVKDAQLAFGLVRELEEGNPKLALEACENLSKLLARASDERIAQGAEMMNQSAKQLKLIGNPIEIKGKTLDGKDLDWKAYRGKVVLVDFWATWCGPCVAELPNVLATYEKYHDRGFEVVGISLDRSTDKLREFVKDRKLPWACVPPDGGGKELADQFGVYAIPLPILVDRQGRVVSLHARGEELQRLLTRHIGPPAESSGKGKEAEKESR
jgi:thiol-disulfide isomerase/thioredoxin